MATTTKTETPTDSGAADLQARADEVAVKGYIGTVPQGPPDVAHTLAAVAAGKD